MNRFILTFICVLSFNSVFAQGGIMDLTVKDITGRKKKVSEYVSSEGLTVFVFWKSCCPNSLGVLSELNEAMEESGEQETSLSFVLVSLDDSRSVRRIRPIVSSYDWVWGVIIDDNQELARRMNIIIPPQWLILNEKGEEVFRCKITSSYTDVDIYFKQIRNLKLN